MVVMRSLVVAMLVTAFGCGTDTPAQQHMPMSTALVGDWFLCNTPDCTMLRNRGAQWTSDGTWVLLEVLDAQALDPTGTYCASPFDANKGTYTFDETSGALAMTDDLGRDAGGGTLVFTPPMASLTASTGGVSLYIRIDPPRLSGVCAP
jgi:hypothetical protein